MAKTTRHTRDELRELILETGRTMLKEEGLSSGAAALTFKLVFARIEEDTGVRLTNVSGHPQGVGQPVRFPDRCAGGRGPRSECRRDRGGPGRHRTDRFDHHADHARVP